MKSHQPHCTGGSEKYSQDCGIEILVLEPYWFNIQCHIKAWWHSFLFHVQAEEQKMNCLYQEKLANKTSSHIYLSGILPLAVNLELLCLKVFTAYELLRMTRNDFIHCGKAILITVLLRVCYFICTLTDFTSVRFFLHCVSVCLIFLIPKSFPHLNDTRDASDH